MFAFIAIVVFIIIFVQIGHLKTRVKILEDQLHEKGTDNAALPLKTEQSVPAESSVQEAESALPAQDESVPPENVLPDASSAPQRPQPVMAAAVDGGNAAPASSPETACALSQAQEQEKEDASPESSLPSGHSFTLVKTLSWIGGFTLFLGVVFWIKYSIENNLISPAMRIVLSASLGVLLLAAGLIIKRPNLKTTADTLSGVGLTILYAAVYGAYIFYQLLGASGAFILMACIAFLSFGVAIWKQAKYVGFLAQVISFITPFLLSVGSDNALFFFTYVACINIAAAAAALLRKWDGLLISSLVFTFLCQLIIASSGGLRAGSVTFCVFCVLYTAGAAFSSWKYAERLKGYTRSLLGFFITGNLWFVLAGVWVNVLFVPRSLYFLALGLWLNFLLVYLTCRDKEMHSLAWRIGKGFVFAALWIWSYRLQDLISPAVMLLSFVAFAAINGGAELFLYKRKEQPIGVGAVLFPTFLMLPAVFQGLTGGAESFLFTCILLCVLMGFSILFAAASGKVWAALFAALLFLVALIGLKPSFELVEMSYLVVLCLGLLPVFFIFGVARWVMPSRFASANLAVSLSALMPYLLTLSVAGRMPEKFLLILPFVLGLNVLCLFLSYIYQSGKILPGALVGSVLLQLTCFLGNPESNLPAFISLVIALNAVFMLLPFVFKQRFFNDRFAWAMAAVSGLAAFVMLHLTLERYYDIHSGLLSALFALIYFTATYLTIFWQPVEEGIQRSRLAWLAGTGLFFLTAFFPLQFSGSWVDVSWALEGAALVWLNRKLMHKGLTRTAFVLLGIVFLRVLFCTKYTVPANEGGLLFINHFLYEFGIPAAAMLYAACAWKPQEETGFIACLKGLGGMLLFILMHIEIAVCFSQAESNINLDVFGSFNSAIVYTMGWTVFGASCLLLGWGKEKSFLSKIGWMLIGLALFKLFFSDIWALDGGYRIIGLFGVSIVLIGISFMFQMLRKKS